MSCCGQKRVQMSLRPAASTAPAIASSAMAGTMPRTTRGGTAGVILKYVGHGALVLRGPRSGRTYQMFTTGDLALVHPEDVDGLIRMRAFIRER